MSKPWLIYTLTNPRTNEVRYVGWTSQPLNRRLNGHIQDAVTRRRRNHRTNWILSLLSIGIRPVIAVVENGTGDGWAEAEQRWIAYFRKNGKLTNSTDGGEGSPGYSASAKTRELLSQRAKGKKLSPAHAAKVAAVLRAAAEARRGKPLSEEHRQKIGKALKGNRHPDSWAKLIALNRLQKGVPKSPEARVKMSQRKKGRTLPTETREKMSAVRRGRPWSPARHEAQIEASKKMSASRRGKAWSSARRAALNKTIQCTPKPAANGTR